MRTPLLKRIYGYSSPFGKANLSPRVTTEHMPSQHCQFFVVSLLVVEVMRYFVEDCPIYMLMSV